MFGLTLITPPAVEPVSLAQAKQHLVIAPAFTDDDPLLASYITAARQYCERYTHRAFFNQTWRLTLDHFPAWNDGTTVGAHSRHSLFYYDWFFSNLTIRLPKPTVQSITSITYLDTAGNTQTIDPSEYRLDANSEPARLSPAPGAYWPYSMQYVPGSVSVTYVAGSYGDGVNTDACPQTIVMAILLLVAHWYANREATSQVNLANIPLGVNALLDTEKLETFGFDL